MSLPIAEPLSIVDRPPRQCGAIERSVAQLALALLGALALTLAVRRAGGAFSKPLPFSALAVIGAMTTLLIARSRAALPHTLAGRALPSWLGATIGLALAVRGTTVAGFVVLVIGVLAEALWHWRGCCRANGADGVALKPPPPIDEPVAAVESDAEQRPTLTKFSTCDRICGAVSRPMESTYSSAKFTPCFRPSNASRRSIWRSARRLNERRHWTSNSLRGPRRGSKSGSWSRTGRGLS